MAFASLFRIGREDASGSSISTSGSDVDTTHSHGAAAAVGSAWEGLGSSGSRVISAIISRSCGERTDDGSCALFGKRASCGPKCDGDEVAARCAITGGSVCLVHFFFTRLISGIQECMRERTNLLIRLVGDVHGWIVMGKGRVL